MTEITGQHPVSGEIETRDVMRATDVNGVPVLRSTGYMPTFLGEMVDQGDQQLHSWFEQVKA